MKDYIKTTEKQINHLLPLNIWSTIDSYGRLSSLSLPINAEPESDSEKIGVLIDCVRELAMRIEDQNMLIKYLMDNSTYSSKELDLS